jgi:uncharacterized PurR-regulated membrane protein YhhQ (DUF165 family)
MQTEQDPWLSPSRQSDYPGRPTLVEEWLHARREGTFLVLAATFLVATVALPILGTIRVIDVADMISSVAPDRELPVNLLLPFGVLVFPLAFVAFDLVCDLYGRRRASALLATAAIASFALIALVRAADALPGPSTFAPALALASCAVVAHVVNLLVFDGLRRQLAGEYLAMRAIASTIISQGAGWGVFGLVMYAMSPTGDTETITALGLGACIYAIVCGIVATLPLAVAAGAFAVYLRIGRYEREPVDAWSAPPPVVKRREAAPRVAEGSVSRKLPQAEIVEETAAPEAVADDTSAIPHHIPEPDRRPRRRRGNSLEPFNSAEMRFFTEGEEMYEDEPPRN